MTNDQVIACFQGILHDCEFTKIDEENWKVDFCLLNYDPEDGIWSVGYEVSYYSQDTGHEVDIKDIGKHSEFAKAIQIALNEIYAYRLSLAKESIHEIVVEEHETITEVMFI